MRRVLFKVFFVFLLMSFSAEIAAPAERLADRLVLPNGIVLLHAEKKALPIVTVSVVVKAGSIYEPPSKAGLANLTADLLNEGTFTRTSQEISEAIEFVGGSLSTSGGEDFATAALSVLRKDLDLGFDLLSDILLRPSFKEEEISRRKQVIKSSIIRQKEDPETVASKAFLKEVFGDHPYGRPVEGTEESVEAITREDISSFHASLYRPNNTIIAVSGDVRRDELLGLLEKYFGKWEKGEPPSALLPEVSLKAKPETVKIDKKITQSNIILGHIGVSRLNPDYYAVSVMNFILGGGGFSSRLMDNIRDNLGLSYDVHSRFSPSRYGGSFQVGLQTKNESANTAIAEILKEMERIRTEPVTDKELSDAKSYLTGSFPLRIDSNSKIAGFLTAVEFYELGMDYAENYKGYINAVTKEEVLRVARKYLHPEAYLLVVVGDMEKAGIRY